MAVGMRDAPGDPSATSPPSAEETTVGLMLETRRSPGFRVWNPLGLSSGSPRLLLSGIPVPGTTSPEPYPMLAVMETARPSESTHDRWLVCGEPNPSKMRRRWACAYSSPVSRAATLSLSAPSRYCDSRSRSEEHTSELQSHRDLHSFPTRRSSDLPLEDAPALGLRVLLAGKPVRDAVVERAVEVLRLSVLKREPHRAGHHLHELLVGQGREVVGRDHPEHLGERRAAGGGRAVRVHPPGAVAHAHRVPDHGPVLREIDLGEDAPHRENVGGHLATELTLIEEVRAPLADRLQGVGELGEAHLLPLPVDPPVLVEVAPRLVGEPEDLLGDGEPEAGGPAQPEPLPREPYGGGVPPAPGRAPPPPPPPP